MLCFHVILIFSLFSCSHAETNVVSVNGRSIQLNGEFYLIKGICYHPVPRGSSERSFETLTNDLALMKEAGINTIRVYSPVDDKIVLDKIHEAGITIIV